MPIRRSALLVASVASVLALSTSPALAARGHEFDPTLTLGTQCSTNPCGPGELKEPSAVAVDEATAQVYVLDQGNSRVEIFDGETGTLVGGFDGAETPAGSFEFPAEPQNGSIAIDNFCALQHLGEPKCREEDPSAGDVYVLDSGHRVIDKFTPDGEYTGTQITEAGGELFSTFPLTGVAVDAEGDLWVNRQPFSKADDFSDSEPNAFVDTVHLEGGFAEPGFAVDTEGNFYGRILSGSPPPFRIRKYRPDGSAVIQELDPEASSSVAVELTTDTAFLDNLTSIAGFEPDGTESERLGEGHLIEGAGIGVDASSGFLYVADFAAGHVVAFRPDLPGPPTIEPGSSVSAVSSESATLEGVVNPRSEAGEGETTYHFEYGPCASPADCATSPYPLSSPIASLAPSFEPESVDATIAGLRPGAIYHYRLFAENGHGSVTGGIGTFTTESAASFLLPDNREWELVSPPHKLGAQIGPISESGVVQAAADGSAITYLTQSPTEASPLGYTNHVQVLSRRGASGWTSDDLSIPHPGATGKTAGAGVSEYKFFDPELTRAAVQPYGEFSPQLSPAASEQTAYLRDLGEGCGGSCFTPLVTGKPGFGNVTPPGIEFGEEDSCRHAGFEDESIVACGPQFVGASEDLEHVVLSSKTPLSEGAGETQLYEWNDGALTRVSVLPDGEPSAHAVLGRRGEGQLGADAPGAVSADGSRVAWTETASEDLYLTDTELGRSVLLSAAEPDCPGCESGGGVFQFASADGSRLFFTDARALTSDSGAVRGASEGESEADLYECRIAVVAAEPTCELSDLTPSTGGEGADVSGAVLGASRDGSSLYFVANGVLAANEGADGNFARPSACLSRGAANGTCNLYGLDEGSIEFVASLSGGDEHDWSSALGEQPTRVSADGGRLAFMSQASPTGYDNRDVATGRPVAEVYLYDAATHRLLCASCDPTGARPHGIEYAKIQPPNGLAGGGRGIWGETELVGATVPGWTAGRVADLYRHQPRYLLGSGRLFFNSLDPLAPGDSNGTEDVYEYEPPGIGGCTEADPTYSSASGGCVDLISSGTSGEESAFLDSSESGDDVFFLTSSRLTKADTDSQLDVYDAHVCSAASPCLPEPAEPPAPCAGEACQAPGAAPAEATPHSQGFSGPGNPKPARKAGCPKGKVRKAGRCVKRQQAKKHQRKSKAKKRGRGRSSSTRSSAKRTGGSR